MKVIVKFKDGKVRNFPMSETVLAIRKISNTAQAIDYVKSRLDDDEREFVKEYEVEEDFI
jgi:hypothetical protein